MLFNKLETLPREERDAMPLRRLQYFCSRTYTNVSFYRNRFDEIGVTPLESRLQKRIKEFLAVTAKVRLLEPHSLVRLKGKAVRIVDNRPKD